MTTITTRSGKGSPLTNAEVDSNFVSLNDDKVEASGDSMTGNLSFGDNNKAIFGTGSDLQIYHDGSNSYITDSGTGNLRISGTLLQLNDASFNKYLLGSGDSVTLYNADSAKLATTSTGIDVTGVVEATGYLSVEGTSGNTGVGTDRWIGGDGTAGTWFYNVPTGSNHYFAVNNTNVLGINSTGIDVTGTVTADDITLSDANTPTLTLTDTTNTVTNVVKSDNSVGTVGTSTTHDLYIQSNNTVRQRIRSNGDIAWYNDAASSQDLYWDASTSRLGLGTTTPSSLLELQGADPILTLDDTSAGGYAQVQALNGSLILTADEGGTVANSIVRFDVDGSERMRIDSSGNILFGATGTAATSYGAKVLKDSSSSIFAVHRQAADGDLITFARGGTDAGGISYSGGYLDVNGQVNGVTVSSGGTERMRIDSSGRVGIGTQSPAVELDVVGTTDPQIRVLSSGTGSSDDTILRSQIGGTTASNYLYFGDADDNNSGQIRYVHSDDSMRFYAGATTERLRLYSTASIFYNGATEIGRFASNNYFGIGLNNPTATLTVNGTSNGLLAEFGGNNSVANRRLQLNEYAVSGINNSGFEFNAQGAGGSAAISFSTLGTEIMRIGGPSSSNRVGIGITNPAYKLVVSNGGASGIEFGPAYSGTANLIQHYNRSGAAYVDAVNIAGQHRFAIGATEAMRINSSGNVGIGTASPAFSDGSGLRIERASTATLRLQDTGAHGFEIRATASAGEFFSANSKPFTFITGDSERLRIDSSGNLLVGKTSTNINTVGHEFGASGYAYHTRDSAPVLYLNRKTSDGDILKFYKDGTTVGSIGTASGALQISGGSNSGLQFSSQVRPMANGVTTDAATDLGRSANRWRNIYASNGTIQTSDRNEKQDIEELTDAEQRVAVACKGLLRKFRWIDSVEAKGDDARIHFGIIAQDLQDAFTAEGLDAGRYGMFINSTWTDEKTGEERTRMGVRYSELLAFIISAI